MFICYTVHCVISIRSIGRGNIQPYLLAFFVCSSPLVRFFFFFFLNLQVAELRRWAATSTVLEQERLGANGQLLSALPAEDATFCLMCQVSIA